MIAETPPALAAWSFNFSLPEHSTSHSPQASAWGGGSDHISNRFNGFRSVLITEDLEETVETVSLLGGP